MKAGISFLWALAMVPLSAEPMKIWIEGHSSFQARTGKMRCEGKTRVVYQDFEINVDGQFVQFVSARLSMNPGKLDPKRITARPAMISMVAVGQVVLRRRDASGHDQTLHCRRAVYLPAKAQWLIDGKPLSEVAETHLD